MKKIMLCVVTVIALITILIPSTPALAFDSKTMNRISYEYANVNWTDNIDLAPQDGIFDMFAVWNINVNKTDEGTNVNLNIDIYNFWPPPNTTPSPKPTPWPSPDGREWGGIYTTDDVFSLAGKKGLTGATLSSVTFQTNNDMGKPPRSVTVQIDWTAFGTLFTSSERGQYTNGDTTTKYSMTQKNIQATPVGTITVVNPPPALSPPPRPVPPNANGNIGTYERTETIIDK
jgi:hypothetical protein